MGSELSWYNAVAKPFVTGYQMVMQGIATETVGENFQRDLLHRARDKTLELILEAAQHIRIGTTEAEAKKLIQDIQGRLGSTKSWHPPQIRFGENSVLPFNQRGVENPALAESDIYFLDLGPIFDDHEGDVGRAFTVGNDPEMKRCCADVEAIWHEVRRHWEETQISGKELYDFAIARAESRGWKLSLQKANGHRIADFPHAAKARGSIEEFQGKPAPDRWILEIQIRHPTRNFGAFYEDLLH